ncbi:MAG: PIN domain-containing protein [Geobacter sp.]|nr:PIN domain-containing protein [Geobacter sp.]
MVKVLVDTSVWIEFFRKRDPVHSSLLELLDADRVCCTGLILGELIQGAKSERELAVIKDFTHVFQFLPETPLLWEKAGRLSYTLRRKGITVGLADCFIAVSAIESGTQLLTLDSHFEAIRSTSKLFLYTM